MPATAVKASQPRLAKIIGGSDLDQIQGPSPNISSPIHRLKKKVTFKDNSKATGSFMVRTAQIDDFSESEPINNIQIFAHQISYSGSLKSQRQ
jgi:hypothetical protein